MTPEDEAEFDRLARFLKLTFSLIFQKLPSKSGNEHPYNALMTGVQADGKAKHMTGLKQAVNDMLVMIEQLPDEAITMLDSKLAEIDAMTVAQARRNYWRKIATIRKRGKIKNDSEFYILKDVAGDDPQLLELLESYEFRDS